MDDDRIGGVGPLGGGMPLTMAIRAEEIAFRNFILEPRQSAGAELADFEQLRRWVAMVELERSDRGCVPTVHAASAGGFDQLLLSSLASLLLGPIGLGISLPAARFR